jgi:Zn-finger nucleic acid-binding protein
MRPSRHDGKLPSRLRSRKLVIKTGMKCPVCKRALEAIKVGNVVLDVCQGGCGGIWFDGDELDKVARSPAVGKQVVAEITRTVEMPPDEHPVLKCRHCRGVKLEQKLFSLGSGVIMDRCPKCAGIWLDFGELEAIREETIPAPRPVRHVVERSDRKPMSVPINFQIVREVQRLRISVA